MQWIILPIQKNLVITACSLRTGSLNQNLHPPVPITWTCLLQRVVCVVAAFRAAEVHNFSKIFVKHGIAYSACMDA